MSWLSNLSEASQLPTITMPLIPACLAIIMQPTQLAAHSHQLAPSTVNSSDSQGPAQ